MCHNRMLMLINEQPQRFSQRQAIKEVLDSNRLQPQPDVVPFPVEWRQEYHRQSGQNLQQNKKGREDGFRRGVWTGWIRGKMKGGQYDERSTIQNISVVDNRLLQSCFHRGVQYKSRCPHVVDPNPTGSIDVLHYISRQAIRRYCLVHDGGKKRGKGIGMKKKKKNKIYIKKKRATHLQKTKLPIAFAHRIPCVFGLNRPSHVVRR